MKKILISCVLYLFPAFMFILLAVHHSKNKNSAISDLGSIDFSTLFAIVLILSFSYLCLFLFIFSLCQIKKLNEQISTTIASILSLIVVFSILLFCLLSFLTEKQFSLLATFIGLPFFTVIPNLISQISISIKNKEKK